MGSDTDHRRILIVGAGVAALLFLGYSVWSRWPPPQLQVDEQVFKTVDALFTALTSRDRDRLADCEQRLKAYHADGRISDAVASRLDGIVQQAHAGDWEPAAMALYDFILGQRGRT